MTTKLSTPSLNLASLNSSGNTTTNNSSSVSSTPLSSRVSQLKQLWEENIKKEESAATSTTSTPRNPVKTRHSVRIDYLSSSSSVNATNKNDNNNNNFASPVKLSITSINKNISAYFHSPPPSSSSPIKESPDKSSTSNNNDTKQAHHHFNPEKGKNSEVAASAVLETTSSLTLNNNSNNNNQTQNPTTATSTTKQSRVSQTILKFTQLIQKTTTNATSNNKTTHKVKTDENQHNNNSVVVQEKETTPLKLAEPQTTILENSPPHNNNKSTTVVEREQVVVVVEKDISAIMKNTELLDETLIEKTNEPVQSSIEELVEKEPSLTHSELIPIETAVEKSIDKTVDTTIEVTPQQQRIIVINQREHENNEQIIKLFVESILQRVRDNHASQTGISTSPHSNEDKHDGNTISSEIYCSTATESTDNVLTSIDTVDTELYNNGDLTETSGHTSSSMNDASDDDATCNDEEDSPSGGGSILIPSSLATMDILSHHSLKPIAESQYRLESTSGHFAEALSSSSTISFNIGNVFKDVKEIEKNEDYAKYFRKTNYNTYQENITSMVVDGGAGDKRRSKSMVKKILENQLISHKIKRIVEDYRNQQWIHKQMFHSLGSKRFEDFTSSKVYLDDDEEELEEDFEQVFSCGLFEESQKIVNTLYEEEIAFVNPLYDEEYVTTNPLFDPTEDLTVCIYNFEEDEKSFIQRLKAAIPRQKNLIRSKFNRMHAKSFSGADLVDWIMENGHERFLRLDASWFAQQMMDRMVFISMDKFSSKFEDDPSILYIFTDEYESSNTLNVDPSMLGVFEPQSSYMSIYRVIKQVGKEIQSKYDQSSKYNDLPIFDYQGFAFSEHFSIVLNEMRKLQKIDTTTMLDPTFRKCFFINIHNIMVLHATITCGKPTNFLLRKRFFRNKKYMIGRYKLSLDMIAHGILRGEKYQRKSSSGNINVGKDSISSSFREKLFRTSSEEDNPLLNAISNLRIPDFDPRIHFCLFRADMSSPKFNLFSVENLENEIDMATREFIQRETRIDVEKNTIHVSKIFEWFKEDFGSQEAMLEYLFKYLDSNVSSKICILKQGGLDEINIEYKYNSSLNIPSNISSDDNKEVNVELEVIRSSEKLRPYFIQYCEMEHSEENILFWARVEEFKALMDNSKQVEEGRTIYNEYLRLGSERELNVSRRMVKDMEAELFNENDDSIRADIFDPIQRVIALLMIDTYERFVTSIHYKQVVEVLKEEMNIEIDTPRKHSTMFISTSYEDVFDSNLSFKELQHRRSKMSEIRTTDTPLTSSVMDASSPGGGGSVDTPGSPVSTVSPFNV